jgi:hypothetical protein
MALAFSCVSLRMALVHRLPAAASYQRSKATRADLRRWLQKGELSTETTDRLGPHSDSGNCVVRSHKNPSVVCMRASIFRGATTFADQLVCTNCRSYDGLFRRAERVAISGNMGVWSFADLFDTRWCIPYSDIQAVSRKHRGDHLIQGYPHFS